MKIKLEIRTPIVQAQKSAARLKPFIIGLHKVKIDQYVSANDDTIYWEIDGSIRDILKIQRNASVFGSMMSTMLTNKMVHGALGKLSKDDQRQLHDMLINQTKVTIIREATAQEIVEENKTMWQKIKDSFQKSEA